MKKPLLPVIAALAFASVTLSAGAASADYICETFYIPGSSNYGSDGYAFYTWYTGADCTGTYRGSGYLCSRNATNEECAKNVLYRATSDAELIGLATMLANAAGFNWRVEISLDACMIGPSTCAGTVRYR
jgi:hypothetical protein